MVLRELKMSYNTCIVDEFTFGSSGIDIDFFGQRTYRLVYKTFWNARFEVESLIRYAFNKSFQFVLDECKNIQRRSFSSMYTAQTVER